ncbi:MAG: hypothetical protein MJ025_01990 [Victivallaceae bacterium]|nr:hypothetical protein [Victivallaceae bacterium]
MKYLLSLSGRRGISPVQLAHQHGAASIGDLDRHVVSQLITELKED